MNKQYTRLDGELYEIVHEHDKTVLRIADPLEVGELELLNQLDRFVNVNVGKMVEEVRADVLKEVNRNLKSVVLGALGFRDSWGKWEVDNCNGRKTNIGDMVAATAQDFIKQNSLEVAFEFSQKDREELLAALRKEFFDRIRYSLRDTVHHMANDTMRKVVEGEFKAWSENYVREEATKAIRAINTHSGYTAAPVDGTGKFGRDDE